MKLSIVGHGKMGKLVEQLAPEYGCSIHSRIDVNGRQRSALVALGVYSAATARLFPFAAALRASTGARNCPV